MNKSVTDKCYPCLWLVPSPSQRLPHLLFHPTLNSDLGFVFSSCTAVLPGLCNQTMVLSAPGSTYGHQRPVAGPPASGFIVHSTRVYFPFLGLVQATSSACRGLLTRPWSSKAQRACLESQQCPHSSQPTVRASSDT